MGIWFGYNLIKLDFPEQTFHQFPDNRYLFLEAQEKNQQTNKHTCF
jgi:hypothetical protein